jgi:hypothetical protein
MEQRLLKMTLLPRIFHPVEPERTCDSEDDQDDFDRQISDGSIRQTFQHWPLGKKGVLAL